jgi:hypothetical protein
MRVNNEIHICISGGNKRDLLMEIVRALEDLHLGFPNLKYQKLIPCNCVTCTGLETPHFYALDDLLKRLHKGRATIECNESFDPVNIHALLDDGLEMLGRLDLRSMTIYGDYIGGDKLGGDKIGKDKFGG